MDQIKKVSTITVFQHWLVGIAMITLAGVGTYMTNTETYSLYDTHKLIGSTLILFIVVHVALHLRNGRPQPVGKYAKVRYFLVLGVYWILLLASVLLPVVAIVTSRVVDHGINLFDLTVLPENRFTGKAIFLNEILSEIGETAHRYLGHMLSAVALLLIWGALKRYFLNKDATP